jgi:ABC-type nitrate/sulfonate/bicarbonate transport system ATPase subunit
VLADQGDRVKAGQLLARLDSGPINRSGSQKPNLIPFLTALENVQVALEINDTPASKARERALELLDYLMKFSQRPPSVRCRTECARACA